MRWAELSGEGAARADVKGQLLAFALLFCRCLGKTKIAGLSHGKTCPAGWRPAGSRCLVAVNPLWISGTEMNLKLQNGGAIAPGALGLI